MKICVSWAPVSHDCCALIQTASYHFICRSFATLCTVIAATCKSVMLCVSKLTASSEFWKFSHCFAHSECCCTVDVLIKCRSSSERKGVETRQTAAKRGLFHRIHDRLKVTTTHDKQSVQKNAAKV